MATTVKKGAVKDAPKKVAKSAGTALSAKNIARLKSIGVDVSTEEEAREKLLLIFKKNGLDDMGNDPITDLIEMAEAFPDTEVEAEEEIEEVDEAEVEDVPAPKAKKAGKGKKVVEEEPEPEEEEEPEPEEEEEVEEAEEEEDETGEPDTEEETEEEEVVEEKPKKKAGKEKKAPKAKTKTEEADEEADALVEEVEEKELKIPKKRTAPPISDTKKAKKKSTRVRKLQGKHWEDLTTAEKDKAVKPLRKVLPESQFRFEYLLKSVVIKYLGKSNEHNIFKFHLLRLLETGKLEGVLISHRFKTAEEFQAYLPEDLTGSLLKTGVSCSYIQPFNQDQLMELLTDTDFLKDSIAIATKQDTKMKANREKLEQQLNGTKDKKSPAKSDKVAKKTVKVVEPEEEEEEAELEEEVVEEKPKKTAKKEASVVTKKTTPPAKTTVKKAEVAKPEPKKKK